jgi:hypothetical protein
MNKDCRGPSPPKLLNVTPTQSGMARHGNGNSGYHRYFQLLRYCVGAKMKDPSQRIMTDYGFSS